MRHERIWRKKLPRTEQVKEYRCRRLLTRTSTVKIHYTLFVQLEKPPTICDLPPRARLPRQAPLLSCYELSVFRATVKSVHTRAPVPLKTGERVRPQDAPLKARPHPLKYIRHGI